jgi:hypothetical protein
MYKLAALPLLFFPLFAFADCRDELQTWAKNLHPKLKFDSARAVCKINPADPTQVLAALPFAENVDKDDMGDYGLGVLVASATNGNIVAHHYQSAAISSDAIRFESLSLDTARYQIAPKLRAFGVRVTYEGASRVNPLSSTTLSLYVLDGLMLGQVMNKLEVRRSNGEWDGNCAGDIATTRRTLSIGNEGKNGFSRLLIDEKVITSHTRLKGDDCEDIDGKPATARFTLDYDGSQYGVPKGLSFP